MKQTILITGANRGIGLSLTSDLLANGHRVIAACRHPEQADDLKKLETAHQSALRILELDVNSDDSVAAAAATLAQEFSALDLLVNNAGVFPEEGDESLVDFDLQFFRDAFETNVIGVARVTRAFLPLLEKGDRPRVVNISSGSGSISHKEDNGHYAYSASKAALNMLTRTMANELKSRGICVVALTPGWVKTEMGGENAPLQAKDSAEAIAKTITSLTMKEAGCFLERTGDHSPYAW